MRLTHLCVEVAEFFQAVVKGIQLGWAHKGPCARNEKYDENRSEQRRTTMHNSIRCIPPFQTSAVKRAWQDKKDREKGKEKQDINKEKKEKRKRQL